MPLQRVFSKTLQQNLATKWPHQSVATHTYVHSNVLMNMCTWVSWQTILVCTSVHILPYICMYVHAHECMNMSRYICMYVQMPRKNKKLFIDLSRLIKRVCTTVKYTFLFAFVCTYECKRWYTNPWALHYLKIEACNQGHREDFLFKSKIYLLICMYVHIVCGE